MKRGLAMVHAGEEKEAEGEKQGNSEEISKGEAEVKKGWVEMKKGESEEVKEAKVRIPRTQRPVYGRRLLTSDRIDSKLASIKVSTHALKRSLDSAPVQKRVHAFTRK